MKNKITKIAFLTMLFSPLSFAGVSQDTWWLAHSKNDSVAQYYLANAYDPDIFTNSYSCAGDEFYLDVKDKKQAGCKEKSADKYIEWLLKSANNHYPLAQKDLGIEYIKGEKVAQNIKQAIYWLEQAAGPISPQANYIVGEGTIWLRDKKNFKGVGEAQYRLAVLYDEGELIKPDYQKAIKYYEMAIKSYDWGSKNLAQYRLYLLYKNKLNDPKNAHYWLYESSFKDYPKDKNPPLTLLNYYLSGGQIDGSMTEQPNYPSAAKQLYQNISTNLVKADDQFNSIMLLGWFYLNGLGVEKSPTMAIICFKTGLLLQTSQNIDSIVYHDDLYLLFLNKLLVPLFEDKLNIDDASDVLDAVFANNLLVEQQFLTSFAEQLNNLYDNKFNNYNYYADKENTILTNLFLLTERKGVGKGYYFHAKTLEKKLPRESTRYDSEEMKLADEITNLYLKAIELMPDDAEILYGLASHYDIHLHNINKALQYYEQASTLNYAPANYRLGEIYYQGDLVKQNYKKAWQWLTLSAQQGYQAAQQFVFDVNSDHADASWLKEQYIEHNESFISPILQINGQDWLINVTETMPNNKFNYYLLKKTNKNDSFFNNHDFCQAAIAYASEGNKALQEKFISFFIFDEYKSSCRPEYKTMSDWLKNSSLSQQQQDYSLALYLTNSTNSDAVKKQVKKLADAGNSDALAFFSAQDLYTKKKQAQGINLAQQSLQQANANAADVLMKFYSGINEYSQVNYYQLAKMTLIRNDLRNIYSSELNYFWRPIETQQYVMNQKLSQPEIFKLWFELAQMYEKGHTIPQNLVYAYVWYGLLSDYNQLDAKQSQSLIEKQLSPEQLTAAQLILSKHRDAYRFYPLTYIP